MAIRINRVYTRTGDKGETRLVGGVPTRKDSARVEAYGTVDELNSVLGIARTFNEECVQARGSAAAAARRLDTILTRLQNELFDLGSELATPAGETYPGMIVVGPKEIRALETTIDRCQKDLAPLPSFILPGGGRVSAFLHQARTVCRRAERDVLRLASAEAVGSEPLRYLNRLSDLLFVLARWIALKTDEKEYLWERGVQLARPAKKTAARKRAVRAKTSTASSPPPRSARARKATAKPPRGTKPARRRK